jgi:hypothetical protein
MLHIGDDLPGRERRIVALDDRAADDEIVRSRGNRLRRGAGALVIVGRGAGKPYSGVAISRLGAPASCRIRSGLSCGAAMIPSQPQATDCCTRSRISSSTEHR